MQTMTNTPALTIQDARKLVKEGWRNYVDLAIGKAWWELPIADAIRSQMAERAREVGKPDATEIVALACRELVK